MTTDEQRLEALRRANEVRRSRAWWKRHMRALGFEDAAAKTRRVLLEPPEWMSTMTVFDLLRCLPYVGPSKARSMLAGAQVSRTRRVGELVDRERTALVGALGRRLAAAREQAAA